MGLQESDVARLPAGAASEAVPESVPSPSRRDGGQRASETAVSLVERIWDALSLLGLLLTVVVSRRRVRPLTGEAVRSLPGDELAAKAQRRWTHAITIGARPAGVWTWLVQMGCRRAGWSVRRDT